MSDLLFLTLCPGLNVWSFECKACIQELSWYFLLSLPAWQITKQKQNKTPCLFTFRAYVYYGNFQTQSSCFPAVSFTIKNVCKGLVKFHTANYFSHKIWQMQKRVETVVFGTISVGYSHEVQPLPDSQRSISFLINCWKTELNQIRKLHFLNPEAE